MIPQLLVQLRHESNRRVAVVDGERLRLLRDTESTYALAQQAMRAGSSLREAARAALSDATVDYDEVLAEGRVLLPLDHPDPAHCLVSGTGLTHLGSARARNQMHAAGDTPVTDSMKLFQWGMDGGKPTDGSVPVQPEWFYKGDGSTLVATGQPLVQPTFAEDGGEEAELAGLYLISDDGTPVRLGFALGNEFSDHVMERRNYLYLAHSKLRPAALGPELFIGDLPSSIMGSVRLLRAQEEIWRSPFLTGVDNMAYTFEGLASHHFKYPQFRRPGDVHVHFFGTSTLSFADGVRAEDGDFFEISAPPFSRPARNRLSRLDPP